MWNKIYLIALAVLIIPVVFLSYYSWSWLQSIGAPQNVVLSYEYWSTLSWSYLWISTVILLIIANFLHWKTRLAWALWTTFLYFATFIIVRYFWLDQSFFQYKKANNLWQGEFSIAPLFGVLLCVVAAVIVFFNQFLIKRLQDKMNPQPHPAFNDSIENSENLITVEDSERPN
ncbi:MAG: hypothetical protein M3Q99_19210 [Acidobacteriota bacterium]|nr:hypothetical protein [Acidobacteriota bacterium]